MSTPGRVEIPDSYETYLELVRTIDTWYRARTGMKSGPITANRRGVPEEIALPVLEAGTCPYRPGSTLAAPGVDRLDLASDEKACPCCGSRFSTYEIDLAVGVGPLGLTERVGADRCGHVEAFLLPRGMALTGGYLSPPRRAWQLLRRGIDPPAGLR